MSLQRTLSTEQQEACNRLAEILGRPLSEDEELCIKWSFAAGAAYAYLDCAEKTANTI